MKHLVFLTLFFFFFSIAAEAQFGRVRRALDKIDTVTKTLADLEISEQDPEATLYLNMVGHVLAEHSDRPGLPYQFIILDSNAVNAFAAPGGFIHITRGALAVLESEAELAGILGHEIAHITEKHTVKGIQKMQGIELADGQTRLTQNSAVFERVAEGATELILQGFSRAEELESDEVGVRLSAKTGYSPFGLLAFLETLKERNQGRSAKSGLFSSHPETEERMNRVQTQIRDERLDSSLAELFERFKAQIRYEPAQPTLEDEGLVEGARGVADSGQAKEGEKKEEEQEEEQPRRSRFSAGRVASTAGFGRKQETAAVSGAGAARAVEEEEEDAESGPKNPQIVKVEISKDDLQKFRAEGNLN